jgi:hypothetical protein
MVYLLGRRMTRLTLVGMVLVLGGVLGTPPASAAVTIGHPDMNLGTGFGQPDPTPPKPEHRLWYAANSWWGVLPSGTSPGFTIWQLERSGTWSDTGVMVDARSDAGADALYNGRHLFVATHQHTPSYTTASRASAFLLRYSFNGRAWVLDKGFPVTVADTSMPAISISQDSTGRILAAYVSSARPWYVVTDNDADSEEYPTSFGVPIRLTWSGGAPDPDVASDLTGDDLAAVHSGNGFTTVVWSNQSRDARHNGFYAARHRDGTPFRTANWSAMSVTVPGVNSADNHICLTAIPGDTRGRIFAVLKTSKNDSTRKIPSDPQLLFAVFTPTDPEDLLSGIWRTIKLTTVDQGGTRPALVIDRSLNRARVFYAAPFDAGTITAKHNQGAIFEKQVDYENLVAQSGRGTVVQRDPGRDMLDDPTTTAQNTDAASGTVVESYARRSPAGVPGKFWHSGTPGGTIFGAAASPTTAGEPGLAYPAAPDVGSARVPTFSSRSKELVSRAWDVTAGAPGRYVVLGVIALILLVPVIATSRRQAARRRHRSAQRWSAQRWSAGRRSAGRRSARRRSSGRRYGYF